MKHVLLEGLPKYKGINEAKTLKQGLKVMMKGCDGRRVRGKKIVERALSHKCCMLH